MPVAFCMESSLQIHTGGSKHTAMLILPVSLFAMAVCSLRHNFINFKHEFSALQDVISTMQGDDRNGPILEGTEKEGFLLLVVPHAVNLCFSSRVSL